MTSNQLNPEPGRRAMNKWQVFVLLMGLLISVGATYLMVWMIPVPILGDAVLGLVMVCGILAIGAMYISSLIWVYEDSKRRAMRPELVMLLVAFCGWPLSLVLWWFIRPEMEMGGVKVVDQKRKFKFGS